MGFNNSPFEGVTVGNSDHEHTENEDEIEDLDNKVFFSFAIPKPILRFLKNYYHVIQFIIVVLVGVLCSLVAGYIPLPEGQKYDLTFWLGSVALILITFFQIFLMTKVDPKRREYLENENTKLNRKLSEQAAEIDEANERLNQEIFCHENLKKRMEIYNGVFNKYGFLKPQQDKAKDYHHRVFKDVCSQSRTGIYYVVSCDDADGCYKSFFCIARYTNNVVASNIPNRILHESEAPTLAKIDNEATSKMMSEKLQNKRGLGELSEKDRWLDRIKHTYSSDINIEALKDNRMLADNYTVVFMDTNNSSRTLLLFEKVGDFTDEEMKSIELIHDELHVNVAQSVVNINKT